MKVTRPEWTEEKVIVVIQGVLAKEVTNIEAMDLVWSDLNTEEHPLQIWDKQGRPIEW